MLNVMEAKKNWNLRVFESAASEFDRLVDRDFRGDKGTCCTAAVLMFLISPQDKHEFVEIIKLAEARGWDGTIVDAARNLAVRSAPLDADDADEIFDEVERQTDAKTRPNKGRGRTAS